MLSWMQAEPERPSCLKLGNSSPTPHRLEWGEGLEIELIINHASVIKPPLKSQKYRIQRASGLLNAGRCGRVVHLPGEGTEVPSPLPYLALRISSSGAFIISSII